MISEWSHIDWNKFHFLRPEFLYLLIAVGLVLVIGMFAFRDEEKWKKSIAIHLRPYVIQKGSVQFRMVMHILLTIFLAIGCLGLAGPTWNEIEVPGQTLETPVVIALDMSQSMMASDIQPNRLERAKFKITDFLDANPRARVALVGYAGTAHTIVPLCLDYNIIKSHLDGLKPNTLPFPGTDVEAVLLLADSISQVSDAPSQLILITDQIDETLFVQLQNYIAKGNKSVELIPMNTWAGAEVPRAGSKRALKDADGNIVYSKLDKVVLNKIGSIEGIRVNQLTLDNSDVAHIADVISKSLTFQEEDEKKENNWQDRGLILIVPIALFILLWFRKGFVIYSLLIAVGLSSCSGDQQFKDLWVTKDYQAQKLEDQGDYQGAGELYEDPMRKGVAYYKAGNYEAAIDAFSSDTTAEAAYNLGLAFYKNGDLAAAQLAFGEAVEKNPGMGDAAKNQQMLGQLIDSESEVNPEDATEQQAKPQADNIENQDMEDLSGGGQEATEEDMKKERKEETTSTDVRKAEELEEVPDDFESGKGDDSQKVLMRKVNDDPALFLKRKFKHAVKKKQIKPKEGLNSW